MYLVSLSVAKNQPLLVLERDQYDAIRKEYTSRCEKTVLEALYLRWIAEKQKAKDEYAKGKVGFPNRA